MPSLPILKMRAANFAHYDTEEGCKFCKEAHSSERLRREMRAACNEHKPEKNAYKRKKIAEQRDYA